MILELTPTLKRVLLNALQCGKLDTTLLGAEIDPLIVEVIDKREQVENN